MAHGKHICKNRARVKYSLGQGERKRAKERNFASLVVCFEHTQHKDRRRASARPIYCRCGVSSGLLIELFGLFRELAISAAARARRVHGDPILTTGIGRSGHFR